MLTCLNKRPPKRNSRIVGSALIILLVVLLYLPAEAESPAESVHYYFFFTRSKHIGQLLQAGDVRNASGVWNREAEYFKQSQDDTDKKCTQDLADAVEKFLVPFVTRIETSLRSVQWPDIRENWPAVKQAISEADTLLRSIDSHQVLQYLGRRDRAAQPILAAKNELLRRIAADVPEQFLTYQPGASRDFFSEYPVQIEPKEFLKSNKPLWIENLTKLSCEGVKTFTDSYKKWLDDGDLEDAGEIYFKKTVDQGPKKPNFVQVLDACRKTKDAGLPLRPLKDTNIRVVQITEPSRLKDGGIEFPVEIAIDAPFPAEKAELDRAFESRTADTADILVVLDIALARNDRKIQPPESVLSKYQSSTQTVPNPDYPLVEATVRQAQMNLQSVRNQASIDSATCQGWGCVLISIGNAVAINKANANVQQAFDTLRATPMTFEKPVYTAYEFRKAVVDAAKVATVNYYIIDRVAQSYVRGTFDVREARSFNVCYGLRDNDPDMDRYSVGTTKEDQVVSFEQAAVTVPLSKIIEQMNAQSTKPVPPLSSLHNEIIADRNKNLAAVRGKTYTAIAQKDSRFDSVVVVFNPSAGMGSGFFVKDDVVLTNYHVIQDAKYVEMKMHDGTETFGKVIAQDVRLDLALIKVQARGVPAKVYSGQELTLGGTVEAIGHPRGLQFSITRGIISAIRELPSEYAPGGHKVRYIQTDAAMSPGNSGGPLFFEDQVIGINTQKMAGRAIEGLGFAIHYGEIIEFLEANGIRPQR